MPVKRVRAKKIEKPTLVAVGNHLIDTNDIACISKIRDKNLYVVRLKSQPNMEYPIWINKHQMSTLAKSLNILVADEPEEIRDDDDRDIMVRWDQ